MKKIYKKPKLNIERFVANESVSACVDFKCDAGVNWLVGRTHGTLYNDLNGNGELDSGEPMITERGSYISDNETHRNVDSNSVFKGIFKSWSSGNEYSVYVYQDSNGKYHAGDNFNATQYSDASHPNRS